VRRVIAAIDNSAAARPVLAMAKAIASDLGGELDVLHVVEDATRPLVLRQRSQARPCARFRVIQLSSLQRWSPRRMSRLWSLEPEVASEAPACWAPRADSRRSNRQASHRGASRRRTARASTQSPDRDGGHAGQGTRPPADDRAVEQRQLRDRVVHVDEEIPSFTDQVQHETEAYAQEFLADTSWARPKRSSRCVWVFRPARCSAPSNRSRPIS